MAANTPALRVRRARPEEAAALTAQIQRSKAHWGYAPALLDAWRPELTLTPAIIAHDPVFCAEEVDSGAVVGVLHLAPESADVVCLDHLFVEPDAMGRGAGALLWRCAVAQAAAAGAQTITLDADPNARAFYERMGAVVVGWTASATVPGRRLPHMRFDLPKRPEP
ncbi:MAG TPA: GNAT family N-acetyltransferase [Ktedonobacterales bacterium]|nr:GNAT family N-acetyltransferase [Ktedonobacterales bacterium]